MGHDVFVSYSKANDGCALEVTARLEGCGYSVWIAPRDVSPSAEWAEEIVDAIRGARLMVLVFSSASNLSPQVRREVERAVHHDLPILPFRIEDVLPTKSLEYFLSSQHWLDAYPSPQPAHYARLCSSVGGMLSKFGVGASASASTGPAPPPANRPSPRLPEGSTAAAAFSIRDLDRLTAQLAVHIGPMAKILVRRAAAREASLPALKNQLAAELDSDQARQTFLNALRDLGKAT